MFFLPFPLFDHFYGSENKQHVSVDLARATTKVIYQILTTQLNGVHVMFALLRFFFLLLPPPAVAIGLLGHFHHRPFWLNVAVHAE